MERIQFYPSSTLAGFLKKDATNKAVSVSQLVTDLLEEHYGLSNKSCISITQLTEIVLKEVEEYIKNCNNAIEFDLYTASATYRTIGMTSGKKPSTIRASIGRSFACRIGHPPFANIRKCLNNGKQKLSLNNALVYETF